jgi:hypothetical protein
MRLQRLGSGPVGSIESHEGLADHCAAETPNLERVREHKPDGLGPGLGTDGRDVDQSRLTHPASLNTLLTTWCSMSRPDHSSTLSSS